MHKTLQRPLQHTTLPTPLPTATLDKAGARSRWIWLVAVLLIGALVAVAATWGGQGDRFDGARAYGYLKQICEIGPRPSGSEAMTAQQKLLTDFFSKLGAKIELQRFSTKYPADGPDTKRVGSEVPLVNIIVRWNPEARERIMLCGHYDTLPYPLHDPVNRRGRFVGANDNASGIAVLMELGNELASHPPKIGVDFVFFDAEEFLFSEEGKFFLGSEYFANDYVKNPPAFRYRAAVLLDMVGSKTLRLGHEVNSVTWDDSRPLVKEIWGVAAQLGIDNFIGLPLYNVRDDHLALHDIAKIPACDLIDFDYPPWHTEGDTPDKCSGESLAKVGRVLREWLKTQEPSKK